MPALTVRAFVMRASEYKDYDRVLTLFAQGHGRITAAARGVRRPKAVLRAAVEPFVFSQYWLFEKQGRYTVTGADIIDAFYPLRTDIKRLYAATVITQVAEDSIREGDAQDSLMQRMLEGYAGIAYDDEFLIRFPDMIKDILTIIGYKPPDHIAEKGLHTLLRFTEERLERPLPSVHLLLNQLPNE